MPPSPLSASSQVVTRTTKWIDIGRGFVGGADPGDMQNVGIIVPAVPTDVRQHRYLLNLATLQVGSRQNARVVSLRQMVTIATCLSPSGEQQREGACVNIERMVRSPVWSFPDGNVVFSLRRNPLRQLSPNEIPAWPAGSYPGYSYDTQSDDPAILAAFPQIPPGLTYRPPGQGQFPGDPIGDFGFMHGIMFPWDQQPSAQSLEIDVEGPCKISLYASVWQTDPTNRIDLTLSGCGCGFEPEDSFWICNAGTVYYRIAGEITAELYSRSRDYPNEVPNVGNCGE